MKRKILLACSLLMIVAVLSTGILAGCAGTETTKTVTATQTNTATVTATATTTVAAQTVTSTKTVTAATATVTATTTAAGSTVTTTRTVTSTITAAAGDGKITVMNPVVENQLATREALAPRLSTLAGKKIYLIDIGWGSGDLGGSWHVFDLMATWLKTAYPTITTIKVWKKGSYGTNDPDLWAKVRAEADAAIIGIAG